VVGGLGCGWVKLNVSRPEKSLQLKQIILL
jgi:hypothetical protein